MAQAQAAKGSRDWIWRLPGIGASVLMILIAMFWTYWGIAEMYHEGWWGAWYQPLPYLTPIALTVLPTLIAFRWPIVGGTAIVLIGGFVALFFGGQVSLIGLAIAIVGVAFVGEGIRARRVRPVTPHRLLDRWDRRARYWVALGGPSIVIIAVSAAMLPVVLTRVDDGDRGARLIEGNGVNLVWAPAGPGWNQLQPWGGYPSWQSLALYGVPPVGFGEKPSYGRRTDETGTAIVYAGEAEMTTTNVCRYLSADGTTLQAEPQSVWRMPTTDEVIRSLGRHGANAGCTWQGEFGRQTSCAVLSDKESPLWATDVPVIYYWTSESYSDALGYFVSFNGFVNGSSKLGGNPRHGYRCVREP